MKLPITSLVLLASALAACTGGVPNVTPHVPPRPDLSPITHQSSNVAPSKTRKAHAKVTSTSACQSNSSCTAWNESINNYNPDAGTYEYRWDCASGGSEASDDTVGTFGNDGSGAYTDTITERDGSSIVWQGKQTPQPNGSTEDDASDNLGNSRSINSLYNADGSTSTNETWNNANGTTTVISGTYQSNGAFSGTETYSDPKQPNYKWQAQIGIALDGTSTYNVQDSWPGFVDNNVSVYKPDGSSTYSFQTDDLSTQVNPDYSGAYNYNADGSGTGGYTQSFDDGSQLAVSDVINNDCTYVESWQYNGPPPSSTQEQTGSITYAADGSGTGSETNYLANGGSQTCSITVAADGTFTLGTCH